MGATDSKFLGCPARKSSTRKSSAPLTYKPATPKPVKNPEGLALGRPQQKYTTKQYERLAFAGDADVNVDEHRPHFQPQSQPQSARAPAAFAATAKTSVDPNEPEWAKFLAKKIQQRDLGAPGVGTSKQAPGLVQSQLQSQAAGAGAGGAAEKPAAPPPFMLHTSEYLRLLKEGEQKHSDKLRGNSSFGAAPPPGLSLGLGPAAPGMHNVGEVMGSLKGDLAGALDSIIQGQRQAQAKKPVPLTKVFMSERAATSQEDALRRIAQMLEPREDNAGDAGSEEEAPAACARDDLEIEKENRDQDLSELVYWSEDDQAPRAIRRASAHKLQRTAGCRPGAGSLDPRCIREYVTQRVDGELDSQVATLLLHLRHLNDRHRKFEPAVAPKRRFVVGIKEVGRGVRQGKAKCVLVAPDIEENGGNGGGACPGGGCLDDRVRELLRVAYEQDVPVVFALSRLRIGRAMGNKALRISVLAIMDEVGTKDLYDHVLGLAYARRVEWLAQRRPLPPPPTPAGEQAPPLAPTAPTAPMAPWRVAKDTKKTSEAKEAQASKGAVHSTCARGVNKDTRDSRKAPTSQRARQ